MKLLRFFLGAEQILRFRAKRGIGRLYFFFLGIGASLARTQVILKNQIRAIALCTAIRINFHPSSVLGPNGVEKLYKSVGKCACGQQQSADGQPESLVFLLIRQLRHKKLLRSLRGTIGFFLFARLLLFLRRRGCCFLWILYRIVIFIFIRIRIRIRIRIFILHLFPSQQKIKRRQDRMSI